MVPRSRDQLNTVIPEVMHMVLAFPVTEEARVPLSEHNRDPRIAPREGNGQVFPCYGPAFSRSYRGPSAILTQNKSVPLCFWRPTGSCAG